MEVSFDLQCKLQPRVFPGQRVCIMVVTTGSERWDYCDVRLDEQVVDGKIYVCISVADRGLHIA